MNEAETKQLIEQIHDAARLLRSGNRSEALLKAEAQLGGDDWLRERAQAFGLTPLEFHRLATYMRARITHWHDQFYTDLPESDFAELTNQIRFIARSRCYQRFWSDIKSTRPMGETFTAFVDGLIAAAATDVARTTAR